MLTDLNFLNMGQPWPVTDLETKDRLEGYAENKALFEGRHSEVFTDLNRLNREDSSGVLAFSLNWHKRIVTSFANMLWGETPKITSENDTYLKP